MKVGFSQCRHLFSEKNQYLLKTDSRSTIKNRLYTIDYQYYIADQ